MRVAPIPASANQNLLERRFPFLAGFLASELGPLWLESVSFCSGVVGSSGLASTGCSGVFGCPELASVMYEEATLVRSFSNASCRKTACAHRVASHNAKPRG